MLLRVLWALGGVVFVGLFLLWKSSELQQSPGASLSKPTPAIRSPVDALSDGPGLDAVVPPSFRRQVSVPDAPAGAALPVEDREAVTCANRMDGTCPFLEPSQESLEEMARCGTVKYDYPVGLLNSEPFQLAPNIVETASVISRELGSIHEVADSFRDELRPKFTELLLQYPDVGPLEAMSLEDMRLALVNRETEAIKEVQNVRRNLARARAGLEEAVIPRTPTEKFETLMAGLGDDFEKKLAAVLGASRARELRVVQDGWGATTIVGGRCDPD